MNKPNNIKYYSFKKSIYDIISLNNFLIFFFFSLCFNAFSQINPDGYNEFYYPKSAQIKSEGHMKSGVPVGRWKNYYETGVLKSEGTRDNSGLLDGFWTFYNESECIIQQIQYKEDKKNGVLIQYDSTGTLVYIENYQNGILHGEKTVFYPNGNVNYIEIYQAGKLQGKRLTFSEEDGRLLLEEIYQDGEKSLELALNRKDEEGNKIGLWREFHDNGVIKREGNFKDGIEEGIFKNYNKKGELDGLVMYKDGVLQENSDETEFVKLYKEFHDNGKIKLIGALSKGRKNGIYREYDTEGNIVNGYIYHKDTLMGEGIISLNGVYQGDWVEYYKDGQIKHKGSYNEEGRREGAWVFYYPNGELKQKGFYKDGLPVKDWTWYYSGGQLKREEYYRTGRRDGVMTEYDSLGTVIVIGNFIDGFKEGEWFYNVADHREVGQFQADLKEGEWKHYYNSNGALAFKGMFKDGLPVGKHVYYHPNGKIKMKGRYIRGGVKHKKWVEYASNGEIVRIKVFDEGKEIMIDGVRVPEPRKERID